MSYDARCLAGGGGDVFLAAFEVVAPALELAEGGFYAQLRQQREDGAERRAVGVLPRGRDKLAPSEHLGGGHGVELHAEHETAYGLVQPVGRAGNDGP